MKLDFKKYFEEISDFVLSELIDDEQISISFSGEESYFMRFSQAKVRQSGTVEQAYISFRFWKKGRTYKFVYGVQFNLESDKAKLAELLESARNSAMLLPEDKYQSIPTAKDCSETIYKGELLEEEKIPAVVLTPVQDLDFTGLYVQGTIYEGVVNSAGAKHWFQTESFVLDYSIWLENGRGVKSLYSGTKWSDAEYATKIENARSGLKVLHIPQKKLEPGKYKAFITADALVEITAFFSWNGFSERAMQQGTSSYLALKEGREKCSPKFSLIQDFSLGLEPLFNENGELAPEKLAIVENGQLKNTLVSLRSETQYGVKSNGASESEGMRSIVIAPGSLPEADAIKELGTGIYISNFNYLNWSDPATARITGMTRFACLWVENGEIVAPISDMRWDESIYNIFGENLIALTKESHVFASTSSYARRDPGGCRLPGVLVRDFSCVL